MDQYATEYLRHWHDNDPLTDAELSEALTRLDGLADLVGVQAVEVVGILVRVLARRDAAAHGVLNDLRALDCAARGPALGPQR